MTIDTKYPWIPNKNQRQHISSLALPIVGGMMSQALLNVVDAAMVGHLGAPALAGVGIGSYLNFFVSALVLGLGSGVQSVTARRFGAHNNPASIPNHDEKAVSMGSVISPLHAGLMIAALISALLIPLVVAFCEPLMLLMSDDPDVLAAAIPYFEIRLLAILSIGLNFSFRGFLNAIDLSTVYMRTLVAMHFLNALLSYVLIFGKLGFPELGAAGAAWGTTLSMYTGSLLYAFFTWRNAKHLSFLKVWPNKKTVFAVLKQTLPNSIQSLFFSAGLAVLFWIIGQIGSAEVAVAHALITLLLFIILPAMGIGMAAATLVGQALGQDDPEQAYLWGWRVICMGTVIMLIPGTILLTAPALVLSIFVHEPELIALGKLPVMITGLMVITEALVMILSQALLGAGAAKQVMWVTVLSQWLLFLPLAWLLGPWAGYGLITVWLLHGLHRMLNAVIFSYYWTKRDWQHIQL
jgi:putative MATE family efflux protein